MTTLIGWIAVDNRKISSLYLASDSRISWGVGREWNVGRKLFAARAHQDVFGYYGEVLFPSLILGQVVEAIDAGLFPHTDGDAELKLLALYELLQTSVRETNNPVQANFGIIYATRVDQNIYRTWHIRYVVTGGLWSYEEMPFDPNRSHMIFAFGSGSSHIRDLRANRQQKLQNSTSRFIYWTLCDAIDSGTDALTGGAPQVVGIYNSDKPARTFGIIHKGNRYFNGLKLAEAPFESTVEWRDELFQRADPESMERLPGAQQHGRRAF